MEPFAAAFIVCASLSSAPQPLITAPAAGVAVLASASGRVVIDGVVIGATQGVVDPDHPSTPPVTCRPRRVEPWFKDLVRSALSAVAKGARS